jgi:hypothetical protein
MSCLLSNVHDCAIAAVKLRVLSGCRVTHQGVTHVETGGVGKYWSHRQRGLA